MSYEQRWYCSRDSKGRYPKPRRFDLLDDDHRQSVPIRMAADFAVDLAGYRPTSGHAGRTTWWFDGDWWYVPVWARNRIIELCQAAQTCEIRRGRGRCTGEATRDRILRWLASGHWKRVIGRRGAALLPATHRKELDDRRTGRPPGVARKQMAKRAKNIRRLRKSLSGKGLISGPDPRIW